MKKLLSSVLVICLLFVVVHFGVFDLTVNAATRNEAVNWLRAQDGAWYNLDGAYGAQCSDFAQILPS